ncbi:MAG: leucine-rich repeat protein, partial [Bacteroidales bacterium]|nr:leucine-rich repeat protein [Bacteroidales bacterium]
MPQLKYLGGEYTKKGDVYDRRYNFSHHGGNGEVFSRCSSLVHIEIPLVEYVSRYCFKQCFSLKSVSLPSAKYIGYGAFSMVSDVDFVGESELEEVNAPLVDSIGWHAFQQCKKLSVLRLPSTPPEFRGYTGNNYCNDGTPVKEITKNDGPDVDMGTGSRICGSSYLTWAGVPMPVTIIPCAPDGSPLTGQDLINAKLSYQADTLDDVTCRGYDGFWFGGDVGGDLKDLTVKVNGGAEITKKRLKDILENCGILYNEITSIEVISGSFVFADWEYMRDSIVAHNMLSEFIIHPKASVPDIKGAPTYNSSNMFFPPSLTKFVGDSIVNIGSCAFYNLSQLTTVEIPFVIEVGEKAFYGCSSLKQLRMHRVERFMLSAFANTGLNAIWMPPIPPKVYKKTYSNGVLAEVSPTGTNNPFYGVSTTPSRYMRFVNSSTGAELLPPTEAYKNAKAEYKNHTGYYNSSDKTWLGWTFFDEHTLTVNVRNGVINTNQAQHTFSELDSLAPVQLLPITAVYYDTLTQANSIRPNSGYALRCLDSIMVYKTGDKTQKVTLGSDTTFAMPPFDVTVDVKYERYYTLRINGTAADYSAAGGTAAADKYNRRFVNETATLTITPAAGQGLRTLVVKKKTSNEDITPTYSYTGGSIVFTMPSDDVEVTVEFQQLYSVTVLPQANGGATANPQNNLFAGDEVELTVTPDAGYKLRELIVFYDDNESNRVSVSPNIVPDGGQCKFNMPAANVKVKPVFEKSYAVRINGHTADFTDGSNTATADKYDNRFVNETVTLTITPDAGYGIKSLSVKKEGGSDIALSSSIAPAGGSCTFVMPDGNAEIVVTFEPVYTVSIASYTNGAASASKTANIFANETISLTLTPEAGYGLKDLTVEDANGNAVPHTPADLQRTGGAYEFTMPAADVTVTPVFEQFFHIDGNPNTPALDTLKEEGGMVLPKDSIFADDIIPIADMVRPANHYEVCSINIKNLDEAHIARDAGGNITHIRMPNPGVSSIEVEVDFCPKNTVTVNYGAGRADGLIDKEYRLGPGHTLNIPVDAADCYRFVGSSSNVDGALNSAGTAVTMPASPVNIVINVSYEKITYTLTYNVEPAGSGVVSNATQTVECGADGSTAVASPNGNHRFVGWKEDGKTEASRQETNVRGDATYTAQFVPIYRVSLTASGGTATGEGYYEAGAAVTLSLSPAAGFGLRSLKVDGAEVGGLSRDAAAHTFTMPAHDVAVEVLFEQLYGIYPDPASPLSCASDAHGNRTCPVDSLFAGERVNIVDLVKPATGYTMDDIKIYRFDGGQWVEVQGPELTQILDGQAKPNIGYLIMPPYDIKIAVDFGPGYKVNITYGPGADATMQNAMQRLEPGQRHTFAVSADGCHELETVTAKHHDTQADITADVLQKSGDQYEVTMPATPYDIDVEVSYKIKTYTLTYDVRPVGAGSVITASTSVACGGDAAEATANANSGFRFARWIAEYNGAETVVGTDNPIALTDVRRDSALIAVFESLYEVTITATNGTVQGAGHYAEGDVVRLSQFKPAAGHKLRHVQSADVTIGFGTDTAFVMPAADVQVDVLFEKFYSIYPDPAHPQDTLTDAHGNRTCPVDSIFAGDRVALSEIVKPQPGYMIDQLVVYYHDGSDWVVLDETTSPKLSEVLSPLPADINATGVTMPPYNLRFEVSFVAAFTITVSYLPAGISEIGDQCTIPASPSTWVRIPIEPKHGYHLVHGGSVEAHEARNAANDLTGSWRLADSTFLMPDGGISVEMTVEFVKDTFDLYYSANPSYGYIEGSQHQVVAFEESGSQVSAVATEPGYAFKQWSDVSTDNPRTDANVQADIGVEALFERFYTIADSTLGGGSVWFEHDEPLFAGTTVRVHSRPAPCFKVGDLPTVKEKGEPHYVAISPALLPTDTTFVMPAHDIAVYGSFVPSDTYSVTAAMVAYDGSGSTTGNPGGTVSGAQNDVPCGASVTLVATPDANHRFLGWYEGGALVSTSTTYTITSLMANHHLEARVLEPVVESLSEVACGAYRWYGENLTFTQSRDRVFEGNGVDQPDTVRSINVTIHPEYTDMTLFEDATFCGSYAWHGQTYDAAGSYPVTLKTATHGCDSIVTLRLAASAPITHSLSVNTCESSYDWAGTTYDVSGDYQKTFSTASGCDSIVTLTLTLNDNTDVDHGDTIVQICTSTTYVYPANGQSYSAGVHQVEYEVGTTCKRRHTITLRIVEVPYLSSEQTVVSCVPYPFRDDLGNDITIAESKVGHVGKFQSKAGCDSLVTLNITIRDASAVAATIDTTTCLSSITLNGQTYSAGGTYTQALTDSYGCDSLVELNLTFRAPVHKPPTAADTIKVETFGSYVWNGSTYVNTGSVRKENVSADGCEITTTVLDLTILDAIPVYDTVSLCPEEFPYSWKPDGARDASVLSAPGPNTMTVERNGITYNHMLELRAKPAILSTIDEVATICQGQTYSWEGQTYT